MASVELSTVTLPTAAVRTDQLPPLHPVRDLHEALATDGIDEEMRANLAYGHVSSLLPYLPQSHYGRELTDTEHPVAVLSNDRLQATFLLGWGARLWSLVDRATDRELLYANQALQPGNLALRDAWFAGGVEWNLGTTGHHPLTCEPLHAARISLPDGTPGLRLWEFERLRQLVLQLDAWLPDGADRLSIMITVSNPQPHDVPVYWWSNIAVPQTAATRVLAPADAAYRFDYTQTLRRVAMPVDGGIDRSYPSRSPYALDYFFDLDPDLYAGARPWIAAVDSDGYGLLQTSSARLRGRKLFVWGTGPGGRRWQDWLSPRGGAYAEIQAGLARTQLEHLPLPAGDRWSWLETYGPVQLDPASAHAAWPTAIRHAGETATRDDSWFHDQRAVGLSTRDRPIGERLQRGSGWGALEVLRRSRTNQPSPFRLGTPFESQDLGADQAPWRAILEDQPVTWAGEPPTSYQTAPAWRHLLEQAAGPWADLHRGVARWVGGDRLGAVDAWEQSLRAQPSAIGWRNLAVAYLTDDHARALAAYREARTLDPSLVSVIIEHLELLISLQHWRSVLAEVDELPAGQRAEPRIAYCEAQAAVRLGDVARAGRILEPVLVLPQLREGAEQLGQLWRDYRALIIGAPAAAAEELPAAYDFSMRPE